jgi:iron complex transport system substrate-binding protein
VLYVKGLSEEAVPAGAIALPDTIQKLVVLSTTHIAFMDILQALDAIRGVPNPALICNSEVQEAIVNEKILPVSMNGQVDVGAVLALEPDLVMARSLPGQSSELVQIQQLGIPVLPIGE